MKIKRLSISGYIPVTLTTPDQLAALWSPRRPREPQKFSTIPYFLRSTRAYLRRPRDDCLRPQIPKDWRHARRYSPPLAPKPRIWRPKLGMFPAQFDRRLTRQVRRHVTNARPPQEAGKPVATPALKMAAFSPAGPQALEAAVGSAGAAPITG